MKRPWVYMSSPSRLEKILESPLDCKEIKPVNSKGNQSWIFTGRIDVEVEIPILWPPDPLLGKDPEAGKNWRQEEKGSTQDEMVGWHHRLDGHEFKQALRVGDGQGSLACCSQWSPKELDKTEQLNWTELNWTESLFIFPHSFLSFKFHCCGFITFFFLCLWANFYSLNLWGRSRLAKATDLTRNTAHKGSLQSSRFPSPAPALAASPPLHHHPIPLGMAGKGVSLKEQTEENLSSADS